MQIVKLERPASLKGEYKVYDKSRDVDIPNVSADWNNIIVGCWIEDNVGVITQVLRICRLSTFQGLKTIVTTCFGTDYIYRLRNTKTFKYPFLLNRKRASFSNWGSNNEKTKITYKDRILLANIIAMNPLDAYEKAYGLKIDSYNRKSNAAYRIKKVLELPESREILRTMLSDILKKKGLDNPEFYINKLTDSIEGPITNSVQLTMLKMLANASNSDEVRKIFEDTGAIHSAEFEILPESEKVKELTE